MVITIGCILYTLTLTHYYHVCDRIILASWIRRNLTAAANINHLKKLPGHSFKCDWLFCYIQLNAHLFIYFFCFFLFYFHSIWFWLFLSFHPTLQDRTLYALYTFISLCSYLFIYFIIFLFCFLRYFCLVYCLYVCFVLYARIFASFFGRCICYYLHFFGLWLNYKPFLCLDFRAFYSCECVSHSIAFTVFISSIVVFLLPIRHCGFLIYVYVILWCVMRVSVQRFYR